MPPFFLNSRPLMQYYLYIIISFCYLFLSCSGSKDVAATIQGKNIYLSEIYQNIDKRTFNALNSNKKSGFVRKYVVHKILTTKPKLELENIGLFIEEEKRRFKKSLIVKEVEKYIFNQKVFSDSLLDFVKDAINTDVYVKAITVAHAFSFGKPNKRTKEEAYKRAKTIYNRLFSGELTYKEALSIYSESSPSKIKGNEMGQLYYGLMPKNFNDVVWQSPVGKLHEPLETPFGFHVIIVDHKIPKVGKNKREIEYNKLKSELKKGKYGFQEENFIQFVADLYEKYAVSKNQDELYIAWDSIKTIDGINTMSGVSIDRLAEVETSNILAKINGSDITLGWIINETENYSFYKNISVNNGFSFYKLISDVITKHLMAEWYNDNEELFPYLEKTITHKSINNINTLYFDKIQKLNPDLTKNIIINRFMLENGVVINSELFAEDS